MPKIETATYNPEKDRSSVHRIWVETGWIEEGDKRQADSLDLLIQCGRALVTKIDGEAECLVLCAPGTIRYLDEDIPFSAVSAVTTSRIGRKQQLASKLTARAVAEEAAEGALVSGLGMFDQGYYDRLGFGTGTYDHFVSFDPQQLKVPSAERIPKRLTRDDWEMMHQARLRRLRHHGAVSLTPPKATFTASNELKNGFGLGFFDGPGGALSHHMWCGVHGAEFGPYEILWMAYETREQFLELLGLLKNLGDQVRKIKMLEPAGIQMQDLLNQPIRISQITQKADHSTGISTMAWWQARICDLPACLAHTKLRCTETRFNLVLSDPIETLLDDDAPWQGTSGAYVVTLGPSCGAEKGSDPQAPTLTTTVNAFTRMWLGVRPASGLAYTDKLEASAELLETLDWAFNLPEVRRDWSF